MTSTTQPNGRITQRRIAELAAVSQATVSLVLNGKADALSRIPRETRDRVLRVIEETGYVADPAARRLAGQGNKIIGVFTYEPAFPTERQDFYTPLLGGIEAAAEELRCDLLLFTSAPVVDGSRRLLHENNRLRLADGCLLLGIEMESGELRRLVADGFPFVAVGRREVDGVPYVAIDYATGTSELVGRAWELGHRRFAYVHVDSAGESVADRRRGVEETLAERGADDPLLRPSRPGDEAALAETWRAVRESGATALVVETLEDALALHRLAQEDGVDVPGELSVLVLSDSNRGADPAVDFTRLRPPRTTLAHAATRLLARILDPDDDVDEADMRATLDCPTHDGATLDAVAS